MKIKVVVLICFCFFLQMTHAQTSESPLKEADTIKKSKYASWSIGPVVDVRAIKSLVVYDLGLQVSRSIFVGQRLRFEAGYRTSASSLEINWGPIPMNMKANIGSIVLGANYDWFPFVASGAHGPFLKSLKVIGGVYYTNRPKYNFDASLQDPLSWGDLTFTQEELGSVATNIRTNKVQPFLGLGYDEFYRGERLNFGINAGVLYHGRPQVTMYGTSMLKPTEENAARLEQNLARYQFAPLLQLLLQYNF